MSFLVALGDRPSARSNHYGYLGWHGVSVRTTATVLRQGPLSGLAQLLAVRFHMDFPQLLQCGSGFVTTGLLWSFL